MSKLKAYDTDNYEIYILSEEDKEYLKGYSLQAAATDGVVPNVYGIRNKATGVIEMYTCNMAAAVNIQNTLEEGLKDEMDRRPKKKANLRSV